MSLSLRAAGVTAALLAASASPAAAQVVAPPTLAGTELSTPPAGDPGGSIVEIARCSRTAGFTAFTATGGAINGGYVGAYREEAAARLGTGGLSEDFETRELRTAAHSFTVDSSQGMVFGTQSALDVQDAGICVKPYFDTASLYLSYATATRYAARIETPAGVYVDRGAGFVSVDVVEALDGAFTANTQTVFEGSDAESTELLTRSDCRRGGFVELSYPSRRECRLAARANPHG